MKLKKLLPSLLQYLPLTLGILILATGSLFVPWREVLPYFAKINLGILLVLLAFGLAFYLSRILRYGYILKTLGQPLHFNRLVIAYFTAQPVSILPAGEVYRSLMLKKHGNVSMRNGVPSVFVQTFTENMGLIAVALISAIILHKYVLLLMGLAALYVTILSIIHLRDAAHKGHWILNKLPFFNITKQRFKLFMGKNQTLLSGVSLVILLTTSLASILIASSVLYITAVSFGVEINFVQAVIAFTLPMILQSVTFLPGGLGVNEQGSVGILLLLGVNLPAAVALTIVVRLVTLGFGILLGVAVIAYTKISKYEKS